MESLDKAVEKFTSEGRKGRRQYLRIKKYGIEKNFFISLSVNSRGLSMSKWKGPNR